MKNKLIKFLQWCLWKLDQPCPSDLLLEDEQKTDVRGYLYGYPEFGRFKPMSKILIFSLEVKK